MVGDAAAVDEVIHRREEHLPIARLPLRGSLEGS